MNRYGVKLTSGKVVWILADDAECRDGMILFYRGNGASREVMAGFNLKEVNHFGRPDAFATAPEATN